MATDNNNDAKLKGKANAKRADRPLSSMDLGGGDDEDLASPSASAVDSKTVNLEEEEDLVFAPGPDEDENNAKGATSKRSSLSHMRVMLVRPPGSAQWNAASGGVKDLVQRFQKTEGLVVSHDVNTGICKIKLDEENQVHEYEIDVSFLSTKNVTQMSPEAKAKLDAGVHAGSDEENATGRGTDQEGEAKAGQKEDEDLTEPARSLSSPS